MAIDRLSTVFGEGDFADKQKFSSLVQEARVGIVPILLVKPKTYMNLSGDAVRKIVDFYKLDPSTQILIIVDDIDLSLGNVRIRASGGPGTHNGMKSLVDTFGEDFHRLRIGLGHCPEGQDLSAWILSTLSPDEKKTIAHSLESLDSLISEFVLGAA